MSSSCSSLYSSKLFQFSEGKTAFKQEKSILAPFLTATDLFDIKWPTGGEERQKLKEYIQLFMHNDSSGIHGGSSSTAQANASILNSDSRQESQFDRQLIPHSDRHSLQVTAHWRLLNDLQYL